MELTIYPKPNKVKTKSSKNLGLHLNKSIATALHPHVAGVASVESLKKLGVKAIFEVEENSDKKKMFSEEWWLDPFTDEKIIGNVWKKRFMIVTSTTVALFSRKNELTQTPFKSFQDTVSQHALASCGKLGTFINLRDICSIQELGGSEGTVIHIVQQSVSGKFSTILRCKRNGDSSLPFQCLVAFKNSLESAVQALNTGAFDLHPLSTSQTDFHTCVISDVCLVTRNEEDQILSSGKGISIGKPFLCSFRDEAQNLQFTVLLAGFKKVIFICNCKSVVQSAEFSDFFIEDQTQKLEMQVSFDKVDMKQKEDSIKLAKRRALLKFRRFDESENLKSISKGILTCLVGALVSQLPESAFSRTSVLIALTASVVLYYAIKYLFHSLRQELLILQEEDAQADLHFRCTILKVQTGANNTLKPRRVDPIELLNRQTKLRKRLKPIQGGSFSLPRSQEPSPRPRTLSQYTSHDQDSVSEDSAVIDQGISQLLVAIRAQSRPSSELDVSEVPRRWLEACKFNEKEALQRWQAALEWRKKNKVDTLLQRKQPQFGLMKTLFKQCGVGTDYKGNLVTIDYFGKGKTMKKLKEAGINPHTFGMHCVFLTEYWVQHRLCSTGKLVKIIDLKGLSLLSFTPLALSYLKELGDTFKHYPECLEAAYLINVPGSFRMVWKIISKFIDKNTLDKFHVLSGDIASLRSILEPRMDLTKHPKEYGGLLQLGSGFSELPFEQQLSDFVRDLNKKQRTNTDTESTSTPEQSDDVFSGIKGQWKVIPEKKKFKTASFKQLCAIAPARAQLMSVFDHFALLQNLNYSKGIIKINSKIGPVKAAVTVPFFESVTDFEQHLDNKRGKSDSFLSKFNAKFDKCGATIVRTPSFVDGDERCLLLGFRKEYIQYVFHVGEIGTKIKRIILSRYKDPMESQCIVLTCTKV